MSKKIYDFEGEKIDAVWDGRLCIHVGECTRAKGELFKSGRQPWGEPDRRDEPHHVALAVRKGFALDELAAATAEAEPACASMRTMLPSAGTMSLSRAMGQRIVRGRAIYRWTSVSSGPTLALPTPRRGPFGGGA